MDWCHDESDKPKSGGEEQESRRGSELRCMWNGVAMSVLLLELEGKIFMRVNIEIET